MDNGAMAGKNITSKHHDTEGEILFNGIQLPKIRPPVHFTPENLIQRNIFFSQTNILGHTLSTGIQAMASKKTAVKFMISNNLTTSFFVKKRLQHAINCIVLFCLGYIIRTVRTFKNVA